MHHHFAYYQSDDIVSVDTSTTGHEVELRHSSDATGSTSDLLTDLLVKGKPFRSSFATG